MLSLPVVLRTPAFQQHYERSHRAHGSDDVHQPGTVEIGDKKLWNGERNASRQRRRPHAEHSVKPGVRPDHPEGHNQREERQLSADHRGKVVKIETGDAAQRNNGRAQCAKCHRRGVGDEGEAGRLQRLETELNQNRGGDGDGRAESRRAFKECPERETNQDDLNARVGSE